MTPTATPDSAAPPLSPSIRWKLSLMMFLQYAIWGAWLPLFFAFVTKYRGLTPGQAGILFSVAAIGALVAPFFAGQLADRLMNTEKFLGISHLIGAALIWQLGSVESYSGLMVFGLIYSMIYAPTLSLTNSLAFHHLPDRDRDFGWVRVWGTVGWIVVGIGLGHWLLYRHTPDAQAVTADIIKNEVLTDSAAGIAKIRPELVTQVKSTVDEFKNGKLTAEAAQTAIQKLGDRHDAPETPGLFKSDEVDKAIEKSQVIGMGDAFRLSAILGVAMGLFCFLLPATPPKKGESPLAFMEALSEIKKPRLLALFLIAFPVSCIHQFYFVYTATFLSTKKFPGGDLINKVMGVGGGGLMTIGQIAEIAVLCIIPVVASKVSRKSLLAIGLIAYSLRFFVFAYVPTLWAVLPAIALHGLCFGCFFFVAFMIVDEETTSDVRASAQSLFNLIVVGLGIIVGNLFAGWVGDAATEKGVTDFTKLYSIPMWVAVGCLAALLLLYPSKTKRVQAA